MLSIDDFVQVVQVNYLLLIVDVVVEEDLCGWVVSGVDMVIYSGVKVFNVLIFGFIIGKKMWIVVCKVQYQGIVRVMKIGKENMVGLVYVLENYYQGQMIVIVVQLQLVV